jgi:alpha-L-arabinofuranosidase
VNPRHDSDMQVECVLQGSVAEAGTAKILHDADWNACNSFDKPDRIVPRQGSIEVSGSKVQIDLPRLSVATVILKTH